ncbi:hypothetical protein ACRAWD_26740 [Caulobacter segnis]
MRPEALAKSYRPGWLFKRDQFPCVSADAVGTLYFRAPLLYLATLRARIEQAELTVVTKYRLRDGEPYKAPTYARQEVGAIESHRDRTGRTEALVLRSRRRWPPSKHPRVVSGYQIEPLRRRRTRRSSPAISRVGPRCAVR